MSHLRCRCVMKSLLQFHSAAIPIIIFSYDTLIYLWHLQNFDRDQVNRVKYKNKFYQMSCKFYENSDDIIYEDAVVSHLLSLYIMPQWFLMLRTAGVISIETKGWGKKVAECRQTRQIVLQLHRLLRVSWTITEYLFDYYHKSVILITNVTYL